MNALPVAPTVTPLEVRPRHSNTRAENMALVSRRLQDAGRPVDAVEFAHLLTLLEKERGLDEHPVTLAARAVGVDVHWVN